MSRHKGSKNKSERERYLEDFIDLKIHLDMDVVREYQKLQRERRKGEK